MRPHSKIIQVLQVIGSQDVDLICLCEDGSIWRFCPNEAIHKRHSVWELMFESGGRL